jgi:hypothetical protein
MSIQTFATADDVSARWRSFSDEESELADQLAKDASLRVQALYPTILLRIAAGTVQEEIVRIVVCGMVKRAMLSLGAEGITQLTESGGPYSESRTFANPSGNLYLTAEDKALLSESGARRVKSVPIISSTLRR